jgi:hypothetical protein
MGQAKRRGTFEQRRDEAIKQQKEKVGESDRELDRNYRPPTFSNKEKYLLPILIFASMLKDN